MPLLVHLLTGLLQNEINFIDSIAVSLLYTDSYKYSITKSKIADRIVLLRNEMAIL